jgi:hypothetical protein
MSFQDDSETSHKEFNTPKLIGVCLRVSVGRDPLAKETWKLHREAVVETRPKNRVMLLMGLSGSATVSPEHVALPANTDT